MQHWANMAKAIKPQGKMCSIAETNEAVELDLLKDKSAMFMWEFMFTRALFETDDRTEQHKLLNRIADKSIPANFVRPYRKCCGRSTPRRFMRRTL